MNTITGPLGTKSVFDFSGSIPDAPSVTDFNTFTKKIRDIAEDKAVDDVQQFVAKAGEQLKEFKQQTQQQLDFITDDNDFSLNQVTGYGAQLGRLRNRQAQTLNDVYDTSLGIVQSRETRRLLKEQEEREKEALKNQQKWQLELMAMNKGLSTKGSRKSLMSRISKFNASLRVPKGGTGRGVTGGGTYDYSLLNEYSKSLFGDRKEATSSSPIDLYSTNKKEYGFSITKEYEDSLGNSGLKLDSGYSGPLYDFGDNNKVDRTKLTF